MEDTALIEQIAFYLCAAYWRGRLEKTTKNAAFLEHAILERVEKDKAGWVDAAKKCVKMSKEKNRTTISTGA